MRNQMLGSVVFAAIMLASGAALTACDDSDASFGYPVGDRTTYPAGGWRVWQALGEYNDGANGRHMAHDVAAPGGGLDTIDAPVYAVAAGVVRFAGPRDSQYRHIVVIEHDDGHGGKICSFYGHLNRPEVETGDWVYRGQPIASVSDWAKCAPGGSSKNTHLHYVLLSGSLCDATVEGDASVCGYDRGGPSHVDGVEDEPYVYTAIDDRCDAWKHEKGFISPARFIEEHR